MYAVRIVGTLDQRHTHDEEEPCWRHLAVQCSRGPCMLVPLTFSSRHTCIPFENLDVFLDQPIALDVNSLFAKVVERGCRGSCFELHFLLGHLLEALGYQLRLHMPRVRWGISREAPVNIQQHMVLTVNIPEGEPLIDASFSVANPYFPLPLNGTQKKHGPLVLAARGWR
ncbi:hypothetical protein HPB51_026306 [Rhipicephalus microplus]|uniref:arylamine N-acetyltransferase n=1 Tax=Rhipicephalus microplus TaxID=6941 RepID=A0A9J6D418_RHIMP|nr:hypothetical protein HPB51_026306 [Rhipicephalus microplus]